MSVIDSSAEGTQGAWLRRDLRDRLLVLASVVVISVIAWAWLALLASDMAQGDMRLMGMGQLMASKMPMSSMAWTLTTFAAMFAMWLVIAL